METCHYNNYNLNINLLRLVGAFVSKYKTRDGEEKKCIVIPVEPNRIYLHEQKQKAMLGMVAIHRRRMGDDTHYLQCRVNPSTIAEKKPPIVGHMNEMQSEEQYEHDNSQEFVNRD